MNRTSENKLQKSKAEVVFNNNYFPKYVEMRKRELSIKVDFDLYLTNFFIDSQTTI